METISMVVFFLVINTMLTIGLFLFGSSLSFLCLFRRFLLLFCLLLLLSFVAFLLFLSFLSFFLFGFYKGKVNVILGAKLFGYISFYNVALAHNSWDYSAMNIFQKFTMFVKNQHLC